MIDNDLAQRLHDRATRGEPLSVEERTILDAWYAQQDTEEMGQLAAAPLPKGATSLCERIKDTLTRMGLVTRKMEEVLAASKQLQEEINGLCQQLAQDEESEIREAYPLMDAVARQEGWDDPEMDSYNIYARKPQS